MAKRRTVAEALQEAEAIKRTIPPGVTVEGIHPLMFTWFRLTRYENGNVLIEHAPYTAIWPDPVGGKWEGYTFTFPNQIEPFSQHRRLFELIQQNPVTKPHA